MRWTLGALTVLVGVIVAVLVASRVGKRDENTAIFPAPPVGFDVRREGIDRGHLETVAYESKTVGMKRKAQVYTPPGYATDKQYPALYLLHGIGGDETEWTWAGSANIILDNLYADQKAVPMIVILPNGRASQDVTAQSPFEQQLPAFAAFEEDLLSDLIPYIEGRYAVKADRASRALAGLSMGGGQSLNFGLSHVDTFAWVGGFSSASNTRPAGVLLNDPADAAKKLRLLWLSCGVRDSLMRANRSFHEVLAQKNVPHVWHVNAGGHDYTVWKMDLYHFASLLFR
jgi:enterochelin esterase-like enzyme